MARPSRGRALGRSPWQRDKRPIPYEAHIRLLGCATVSSNLQPFFPEHTALSKHAQLGMTGGEESQGLHRGQIGLTEALMALGTVERGHRLLETAVRLPIVTRGRVGCAETLVRQGLHDGIPIGCSEREGTLRRGDGLVIRTYIAEMD